jgi:hypothetical protein
MSPGTKIRDHQIWLGFGIPYPEHFPRIFFVATEYACANAAAWIRGVRDHPPRASHVKRQREQPVLYDGCCGSVRERSTQQSSLHWKRSTFTATFHYLFIFTGGIKLNYPHIAYSPLVPSTSKTSSLESVKSNMQYGSLHLFFKRTEAKSKSTSDKTTFGPGADKAETKESAW